MEEEIDFTDESSEGEQLVKKPPTMNGKVRLVTNPDNVWKKYLGCTLTGLLIYTLYSLSIAICFFPIVGMLSLGLILGICLCEQCLVRYCLLSDASLYNLQTGWNTKLQQRLPCYVLVLAVFLVYHTLFLLLTLMIVVTVSVGESTDD